MAEPRALTRTRGPRSISAAVKSNRVAITRAAPYQRYSTSAAAVLKKEIKKGNTENQGEHCDSNGVLHFATQEEEIAALRYALEERDEQVGVLESLLAESKLLRRNDEMLENQIQQHDEQLARIAALLKDGKTRPLRFETKTRGAVSVDSIMDDVQKLRFDKNRMESELAKKEQSIIDLRAELTTCANHSKETADQLLLPLLSGKDAKTEETKVSPSSVVVVELKMKALEQKLKLLQERHARTEARLADYQKECRIAKHTIRQREKELLEWQRKHRDAEAAAAGVTSTTTALSSSSSSSSSSLPSFSSYPSGKSKFAEKDFRDAITTTNHRRYFNGSEWVQLLLERPHAVQTAFLRDASQALHVQYGQLSLAEMTSGPELIALEINIQHATSQSIEDVELALDNHDYTEMRELMHHRDSPLDRWDKMHHQLQEALATLATRDAEVAGLEKKLCSVTASLERNHEERDDDDRLLTRVLDETELTVKEVHSELERQRHIVRAAREAEQQLQRRLQDVTAQLAEKETTVAEKDSQLREAETRRRQEVAATRRQLTERERDLLRQAEAARTKEVNTFPIVLTWNADADAESTPTPLALGNSVMETLHFLLLGEATAASQCAAIRVASMHCTARELRAEVQLLVAPAAATAAAEALQKCRATAAVHFLRDQRDTTALMENRSFEIRRLARDLKAANDEIEELLTENKSVVGAAETRLETLEKDLLHAEKERERVKAETVRLATLLEESKRDVEQATKALEELQKEHQSLKAKSGLWSESHKRLTRQSKRVAALQATRAKPAVRRSDQADGKEKDKEEAEKKSKEELIKQEHDPHKQRRQQEDAAEEGGEDVCVVALQTAYAAHDADARQWRTLERSLRAQLHALEQDRSRALALELECERLREAEATAEALTDEMNARREQGDVLVQTLVHEEEARRELEMEVATLQTKLADSERELKKVKERLDETTSIDSAQLAAITSSMTNAAHLMRQCVSTMEDQRICGSGGSGNGSGLLPAAVAAVDGATHKQQRPRLPTRDFGRSMSYNSGVAASSLLITRTPRCAVQHRRNPTPTGSHPNTTVHASMMANTTSAGILNVHRTSGVAAHRGATFVRSATSTTSLAHTLSNPVGVNSNSLASAATEVLYFAQLFQSMVSFWREKERQHVTRLDELTERCRTLREERDGVQQSLVELQQQQGRPSQRAPMSQPMKRGGAVARSSREAGREDFICRSRAHALCVVLSVADYMRDALTALQSAITSVVTVKPQSFATNPMHDVRIAEECVVFALRRVTQSADAVFSAAERQDVELRRGKEYFVSPQIMGSPHSPMITPQDGKSPNADRGLVMRDANVERSPSVPHEKRSVSNEPEERGAACVDYKQHMSPKDKEVIQQALKEARRRKK